MNGPSPHFTRSLADSDPELARLVRGELDRQTDHIELIASENLVSQAVLEAQGSVLTNKTVEGYPGKRYYGGAEWADAIERLGQERARELFGVRHANLQPHSGSQANQAVYLALLRPGDRIVSMALSAGGHLSHGARFNQSGKWFDVAQYGVRRQDGLIDMDEVAEIAERHRPKLLIAGGSAYPRTIDFAAFRAVADAVGATLMVDMAHFAGLVAGGAHPSPVPHAHVITTTTYKSLRGARGGLVLTDDEALARRVDSALFPGVQGSVLLHAVAAKAACLGEALRPEFREYAHQVVDNARALAAALVARGYDVVSGGTDTALLLLDLRSRGLTGDVASDRLESAGLICNKNAVPFDTEPPTVTSGLRLSSAAGTARGFDARAFTVIGEAVADVLDELAAPGAATRVRDSARERMHALAQAHPIYPQP